jgi:hypothetical protein
MRTREEIINSMCYTWRHDFGLDKHPEALPLEAGMTTLERQHLWNSMAQIFDNDISPLLDESNDIQNGTRVVIPKNHEQAEAMLAAAEFFLGSNK